MYTHTHTHTHTHTYIWDAIPSDNNLTQALFINIVSNVLVVVWDMRECGGEFKSIRWLMPETALLVFP